ncbi:class I SAM-dependent methyltransferase [Acuticoccus kandeliae]|uniref:class I SAM-dependent methyltransferase n=1 Tax=Acuticoccus kandeliae TaxID=2073160 RepID=UPI001FE4CE63|nr:class I SAM-dependent methyltransferase [Acuticoccus kandeliae]
MDTDTAHLAWDATWRTEDGRAEWSEPEADIVAFAAAARLAGAARALDLGCGVGRHALALARLGFVVDALDASPEALEQTRAAARGLPVTTHASKMNALPFADATFDAVVSWNVIYHGDPPVVAATIAEIARVLRPGGRLAITMLSKRNILCGVGRMVATDTWVDDMAEDDKIHPHFYCDAEGFTVLFRAFHLVTLREDDLGTPGRAHWVATLQKRA